LYSSRSEERSDFGDFRGMSSPKDLLNLHKNDATCEMRFVAQPANKLRRTHMKSFRGFRSTIIIATMVVLHGGVSAQAPTELIIRKAAIVNATGRSEGDIRIRGEKIAEIGPNLAASRCAGEID